MIGPSIVKEVLEKAGTKRRMASVDCNERSSGGHGAFCIIVDTRESGSRGLSRRDVNVTASGWTTSMGRMAPGL